MFYLYQKISLNDVEHGGCVGSEDGEQRDEEPAGVAPARVPDARPGAHDVSVLSCAQTEDCFKAGHKWIIILTSNS